MVFWDDNFGREFCAHVVLQYLIFSVIQELKSGRHPFDEKKTDYLAIHSIVQGEVPRRPSDIDTYGLWDICLQCWIFEPLLRPSMLDLCGQLNAIYQTSLRNLLRSKSAHIPHPSPTTKPTTARCRSQIQRPKQNWVEDVMRNNGMQIQGSPMLSLGRRELLSQGHSGRLDPKIHLQTPG